MRTNTQAFSPSIDEEQPARARVRRQAWSPGVDLWLLLPAIFLLGLGVLMVYSTTAVLSLEAAGDGVGEATGKLMRHLAHLGVGLFALLLAYSVSSQRLQSFAVLAFALSLLLLLLVLVSGSGYEAGGAKRWLKIGSFRFQPGEFAKLAVVLYFSSYIGRHAEKMRLFLRGVVIPLFVLGIVAVLLLLQPDFGSVAIISIVLLSQLLTVCRIRHLLIIGLGGALSLSALIAYSPYRLRRVKAFLNPLEDPSNAGYQLLQSLIAVGSGGLSGAGLGYSKQKLFYLPAAHTDFIYAVAAEELGFAGAVSILIAFLLIGCRGLQLAHQLRDKPFLMSFAVGATMLLVVPAMLNMGVVLGLLPTKGLVLPFVAYGGTALVANMALLGVLLRLSRTAHEVG